MILLFETSISYDVHGFFFKPVKILMNLMTLNSSSIKFEMLNGFFLSIYLCTIFWVTEKSSFRDGKFEKEICLEKNPILIIKL